MKNQNLLSKILETSQKDRQIIEVFADTSDEYKFDVGYVLSNFEDYILIHTFDKYGVENGYTLLKSENIFKIGCDTKYIKNLGISEVVHKSSLHKQLENYISQNQCGISAVMDFCGKNNILVILYLDNEDEISGYIQEFDEVSLKIASYSNDGMYEGLFIVNKSNVIAIDFETKAAKKNARLVK